MIIGVVRLELYLYNVQSLKEKRAILKSIRSKLLQRYNVAVSETGYNENWQRSELSLVTVSNEQVTCERELQRVLAFIDSHPEIERTITEYEWL